MAFADRRWNGLDSDEEERWRQWIAVQMEKYVERASGNEHVNLIGAWTGSSESTAWKRAESNFLLPHEPEALGIAQTDPGYFGKGLYFTQFPSYGAKYAKEKIKDEDGKEIQVAGNCLLFSWVLMGRAYPVIETPSTDRRDAVRTLLNKGKRERGKLCMFDLFHSIVCLKIGLKDGFDSHYAVVKSAGSMAYIPCKADQTPDYDEICVFKKQQVLPRYIFFFRRLDQQAAAPIAIPKAIATAAPPSVCISAAQFHPTNAMM